LKPILQWLPRSLIGRVFALYCANLLLFVGGGLALLCQHQYTREIERVQQHATSMTAMLVPVLTRQAARGDPEGVRRTLERATRHTDFASATFVGSEDGRLEAERAALRSSRPPAWLRQAVAARLPEIQHPIADAEHDHGVLLLRFDTERIAGTLWRQAVYALWLTAAALTGGLLVIRVLLVRWLGGMGDIRSLEARMQAGGELASAPALASDAPLEVRQTYDALNRAAHTMQAEREQAAVTLGAITDAVFTLDARGQVVYANAAVEAVFGQWAQSFLGLHLRDVLPELVLGDTLEPWHGRHARHSSLGGREVVVETTLSAIAGPTGGAVGFVLACRDVTETHALNQRLHSEMRSRESALNALRRVLEGLRPAGAVRPVDGADDIEAITQLISELVLQLQERGEQLAAIFDLSPDGFVSFDAQRIVGYVSPTFTRLTGLSPVQVIGLDEPGFASALQALCVDPVQGGRSFEALRLRTDAGDGRQVLELARPAHRMLELGLREGSSGTISQVLYLRDVTHETERGARAAHAHGQHLWLLRTDDAPPDAPRAATPADRDGASPDRADDHHRR
jgi:PAS domain S-box-containing protein